LGENQTSSAYVGRVTNNTVGPKHGKEGKRKVGGGKYLKLFVRFGGLWEGGCGGRKVTRTAHENLGKDKGNPRKQNSFRGEKKKGQD